MVGWGAHGTNKMITFSFFVDLILLTLCLGDVYTRQKNARDKIVQKHLVSCQSFLLLGLVNSLFLESNVTVLKEP